MGRRSGRFAAFDQVSGVYKITNKITGHSYIGKSINIAARFQTHRNSMLNMLRGYGDNPLWIAEVQQYGIDAFTFEILERVSYTDPGALAAAEVKWCQLLRPEFTRRYI